MSYFTDNKTTFTNFDTALHSAIEREFPVIYGIPGSWADLMDFIDDFTALHRSACRTPCPTDPTKIILDEGHIPVYRENP